jgi:hypothetical protein
MRRLVGENIATLFALISRIVRNEILKETRRQFALVRLADDEIYTNITSYPACYLPCGPSYLV